MVFKVLLTSGLSKEIRMDPVSIQKLMVRQGLKLPACGLLVIALPIELI